MKIRSHLDIFNDYKRQMAIQPQQDTDRQTLEQFFGVHTRISSNIINATLANNIGEELLNTLTDFILREVFPQDGSWVMFKPIENSTEAYMIADKLSKRVFSELKHSNFYKEVGHAIRSGLLWGSGFVDSKYNNGLYYYSYDGDSITVSASGSGKERCYIKTQYTAGELVELYEDIPESAGISSSNFKNPENTDWSRSINVLSCILPNTDRWFESKPMTNKKYIKVDLLYPSGELLKPKGGKIKAFEAWPIQKYQPHTEKSPCATAYERVANANFYEVISRNRSLQIIDPPISADESNVRFNSIDLSAGGVTPIRAGGLPPTPVYHLTDGDQINEQKIAKFEAIASRILKVDQIQALNVQGLSQYEYHGKYAATLKGMQSMFGGLTTGFVSGLLFRSHQLLLEYDKEYSKEFSLVKGSFSGSGIEDRIKNYEELSNIGKLGQVLAPFAQINPEAVAAIDFLKLGARATIALGLTHTMKTVEEIEADMQAQAAMQQHQQQVEDTESMSKSLANMKKSQQVKK